MSIKINNKKYMYIYTHIHTVTKGGELGEPWLGMAMGWGGAGASGFVLPHSCPTAPCKTLLCANVTPYCISITIF